MFLSCFIFIDRRIKTSNFNRGEEMHIAIAAFFNLITIWPCVLFSCSTTYQQNYHGAVSSSFKTVHKWRNETIENGPKQ